jgi:hypothetical protein
MIFNFYGDYHIKNYFDFFKQFDFMKIIAENKGNHNSRCIIDPHLNTVFPYIYDNQIYQDLNLLFEIEELQIKD